MALTTQPTMTVWLKPDTPEAIVTNRSFVLLQYKKGEPAMAPLIVHMTQPARVRFTWRDAVRIGLAAMFMFTGTSHFFPIKHDMAAMIPPPLTGALWVIYVTGVLEFAGGLGLLFARWQRSAAWGLVALLVAILPANIYAALTGVTFRGHAPLSLGWRVPLQFVWIAMLWWSTGIRTRRR